MSSWTPTKYKTRNWAEYNLSLKKWGSLSIWFDAGMTWGAVPSGRRGRQQAYSDTSLPDPQSVVWIAVEADDRICWEPSQAGWAGLVSPRLQ